MSLNRLIQAVPPPLAPSDAPTVQDWNLYQLLINIDLPDDYKELLTTYGSGDFDATIYPYNPFYRGNPTFRYRFSIYGLLDRFNTIRQLKAQYGSHIFPYNLYPDESGLLPWGSSPNSAHFYWKTAINSADWTVIVHAFRDNAFEYFPCSTTDFIYGIVSGELHSDILPYDDYTIPVSFQSVTDFLDEATP